MFYNEQMQIVLAFGHVHSASRRVLFSRLGGNDLLYMLLARGIVNSEIRRRVDFFFTWLTAHSKR